MADGGTIGGVMAGGLAAGNWLLLEPAAMPGDCAGYDTAAPGFPSAVMPSEGIPAMA